MAKTASWVKSLSAEELRAFAERLKERRRGSGDAAPEIRRLPRPLAPAPLSFDQERLWFLDRLAPGSSTYNMPTAVRLSGRLSVEALAAALSEVVRRHEILRTRFVTGDAGPLQVVDPPGPAALARVDLAALPPARRAPELLALVAREGGRPFDLAAGPLLRVTLVKEGEEEHALLLTLHHIIVDGWSLGILVHEIVVLYGALAAGRPSPLPPLPLQYADYAAWQRERLSGEALGRELRHWREALAGAPTRLDLPADRPRPPAPRRKGGARYTAIAPPLAAGLRALAREVDGTLFMACLAAFQALLHRLTGQGTLLVGSPIANRRRTELEGLIGLFLNTLALRSDLHGRESFRALLVRTRERTLAAYAHQDLPFEKLVEALLPERDPRVPPLVQALFQLRNTPVPQVPSAGLAISPLETGVELAKLDLVVNLTELGGQIAIECLYNADLFDDTTVERLLSAFARVVEAVAATAGGADLPVAELPLLAPAERHVLLAEWGGGAARFAVRGGLHETFAARAAAAPHAIAAVCGAEQLSYGELDARGSRLARRLLARGVLPGALVGLCLERSLDLPVAILGVLKSGCAYVPLDPDYPAERLAFLLDDSRAAVLLTRRALVERLPSPLPPLVLLDTLGDDTTPPGLAAGHGLSLVPRTDARKGVKDGSARDLAYVIYTSGSTGRPKGVLVEHGHVLRLFAATDAWFGFGPADVWSLFHSYAFDVSVFEIWGALLHGGRLVVVPFSVSRSPAEFLALLARERVTVLSQTPSAFRQLVWAEEGAGGADLANLRLVLFAGEALDLPSLAPWMARHGDARPRLVNLYGITETTVHATYRVVERGDLGSTTSPVGRPFPDLGMVVVDAGFEPAPIGVPGELLVGGAGVTRGYLRRPELTAARFVPEPFSAQPGSRAYRSGDLARWLPSGELGYLGRIDQQVKVRGFRVELGEIESALAAHPAVREAAVVPRREEGAADTRLVAYLTAAGGEPPSPAELRRFLAATLPEPMLPAAFVILPELPLNPNGKLDRRALAAIAPEAAATRAGARYEEPRDALETFLAGLFRESLKVERVGIHDGFFALGGNSIAGAVLINRLQQELGEIVQVVVLFDAPTVAGLAGHLRREHPRAVARRWGAPAPVPAEAVAAPAARVDEAKVAAFRRLVVAGRAGRALTPRPAGEPKNPRALFVLAPPRSGTTLLRVMLGGHPRLFAPPELELLSFGTLAERRAAFSGRGGRDNFWLEGAIRAVMEAKGLAVEAARRLVETGERAGWSTGCLYAEIQRAVAPRMLVDKTPSYALDPAVLARAEELFAAPLYVHLVRHPYGMIHSFEEAKLDQLFFRQPHRFARRELAELVWLASQRNILDFLAGVPAARRHRVAFEDLVARPEAALRELCAFLGLDYHPRMADPYEASSARMTDGLHAASRMLGDVKFHQHRGVDSGAAGRWREDYPDDFLGEPARAVAAELGYAPSASSSGAAPARPPAAEQAQGPPPIRPVRRDRPLPLSFAQERLWFLDRLEPGKAAYNMPVALRLRGRLDRAALAASHAALVARHEALRTTFGEVDGRPVARIAPPPRRGELSDQGAPGAPGPALVDLAALASARREEEALRLAGVEAARPFDLARGPLVRAVLLALAPDEHVALFTLHHAVSDGWSIGILVRELTALYARIHRTAGATLPPLPVQYADFAVWQRAWLSGAVLARQLAHWRRALAGAPPLLALPLDRPRPPAASFRGASLPLLLPAELARRWRELGRAGEATLFMALLAAFSAFLGKIAAADDVVVGTPIAGRGLVEVEGLIGFFANTLALRAGLAGDPDLPTLLARLRETTLAAYAHQDLPFERLVEELQPERTLAASPVFQAMLALQSASQDRLTLPGLSVETVASEGARAARFDLSLGLVRGEETIGGAWEYATDLFDRTTVERFGRWFLTLLAGWAERPEARLSEVPLLSAVERKQLAEQGRGAAYAPPRAGALQDGFFAWAAAHPEDEALVWGEERVSYGDLAARASRIARRLIELGAGPETLVGVCLPRSTELVAALLGVLAAGAAYVPLDPAYPVERLGFMLQDTRAPLILVEAGGPDLRFLPGAPPDAETRRVIDLADPAEREAIARQSAAPLPPRTVPGNLAYVLYTSGSTGRPKGVAIEHRSVLALFSWAAPVFSAYIGIGGRGGIMAGTSISFDVSVFEIFFTLAHGGRVLLAENALALPSLPARGELTLLNAVPSAVAELLRLGAIPPSVRTVNLPGEPLSGKLVDAVYALPHVERVFNLYGPSEDTTYSTCALVPRGRSAEPSIGRPIAGTAAHVLDRSMRPVPPGVAGELYLGGAGLARGYFARPALTAERFVPSPATGEMGRRLYRTGDLVRYRISGSQAGEAAGELEYLGRADRQVKLRGFRIELGEVEAALAAQPGVGDAAAVVRRGRSGEPELAAFYTAPGGTAPEPAALRAGLRTRLPEPMVPSSLVPLSALPLNANGKIDRQALARIEAARPAGSASGPTSGRLPPRNLFEVEIARLWEELLGVPEIGATDGFFELGGHSLLAAQLASRLRAAFGVELPLKRIFELPTLADLAREVESEAARSEGLAPAAPPIRPAPRDRPLPLSFAQERLWFLDRLEPGRAWYNLPSVLRLRGPLDVAALAASQAAVVARHEALRTTFHEAAGKPVQEIAPAPRRSGLADQGAPGAAGPALVDLAALAPERREAEARRLAALETARPFDLARGPLVRGVLLALAPDDHAALFTLHHAIADGWSIGILVRELAAFYGAFARRLPASAAGLPPLRVQYADFAVWQRGWLAGPVLARQLAFWRRALAGAPPVLELPLDRPRPPVATARGGSVPLLLPAELAGRWRAAGRASGTTLFMALLAGFTALLARLSGAEDVVVGTPVAGRDRLETEGLIGCFVNTLALRADLAGDPDLPALLARVREATLAAYAHQDLPFERLVEELHPERSLAVSPIFQALLSLQNAPMGRLQLAGLTLEPLGGLAPQTAKFDLSLLVEESRDGGLGGRWEHNADLFDGATVERFGRWLEALLAVWAERPEARLSEVPLLSAAERRQLAEQGNGGPYVAPTSGALQDGFFAWAAAHPEDEALVWGEERICYGDLAARASRIAHRLIELGAGPETLVGVCLPRSPELVAALLGVLAAGAAYVPLDPAYPVERLSFMLEDTRAPLVLVAGTESPGEPDLKSLPGAETRRAVDLADPAEREAIARQSAAPLASRTVPGNLAYVLYTSGSTGRPKGVAIEHRSVLALFAWAAPVFSGEIGIGGRGAIMAGTSISFDVSVFEIFFTLAHGGRILLAENSLALPSLPARGELTLLNAVPSAVAELLRLGAIPPSVRTVNLPGEPLSGKLVDAVYALGHVERVFNLYGPSEDTTYSTCALVPKNRGAEPSIGRPIAGTAAHVLDRNLRPVPPGVAGELYLGGAGLARGYFARPALTAERFVSDAVSGEPGARLYRTGDLVRYRMAGEGAGELEYLGRIDRQVKLRGFRIELGEVEAALAAQPGVDEAAAVVRRGRSGEPELAAFYTSQGAAPEPAALRAGLRARLPEHMVPSSFVHLAELPLNTNGKIDRLAIASLPAARPSEGPAPEHVAPSDLFEAELARLWEELLGVPEVGATDSFFELGGHSLLAAQLVSRLRAAFGVELPLKRVFELPILADLARAVESEAAAAARGGAAAAPPIRRAPRGGELPLSFAQERLWFLDRLEPGRPFYNMPTALRLRGRLDVAALGASHAALVARHEVLRTTFASVDGRPIQVIAPPPRRAALSDQGAPGAPGPALVDLAALAPERREAEARRLAGAEAARPFDLARGPLVRGVLLALAPDDHVALWNLHHIVSDGWSMGILVREVAALYGAFARRLPSPTVLAPLPIQYADFAVWQRGWLAGPVLARQIAFWRQSLAGAPPVLALPLDRPRPPVATVRGDSVPMALPGELARRWSALGRREDATLFMSLLAAYAAFLSRLAETADVVVGTPVAGRNRLEIEGLIGFFVNTLALRADLSGDPDAPAFLSRVRAATVAAYAHQDLPFERLVEELQPRRSLAVSPIFQALFALQNAPAGALELAGLTLEPLAGPLDDMGSRTAKFDLSLSMGEGLGGALAGGWEFNADLFDRTSVERFAGWLTALLAGWVERPEARLSELPILSEAERRELVAKRELGALPDAAVSAESATGPVAPRDEIERELAAIWAELLGIPEPSVTASFFDLGGHSLLAVRLMARIARRFGRELPLATLFRASTIETLAALLRGGPEGSAAAPGWSPLVTLAAGEGDAASRAPFFCVHPIGGAVFCYRDLAAQLAGERPVQALQARGLAEAEAPFARVEEMAAAYREAIVAAQPAGPYHMGGWSFGALVALEIARQLAERGEAVSYLALIDPTTITDEERAQPFDDLAALLVVARDLAGMAGRPLGVAGMAELPLGMAGMAERPLGMAGMAERPLGLSPDDLAPLDAEARLDLLLARAAAAGALPPDADPAQLRRLLRLYRAHVEAIRAYLPPRHDGPIALFRAVSGPLGGPLGARMEIWRRVAAGGLDEREIPGGHYDLLRPPQVEALAEALRAGLAATLAPAG